MFVRWPQVPQNFWSVAKAAPQLRHASVTRHALAHAEIGKRGEPGAAADRFRH